MIIAISGKMGSGKSTLADGIEQWARLNNMPVTRLKFADPIYSSAKTVYDSLNIVWEKDRKLLQFLGSHFKEIKGETFWTDQLSNLIINLNNFVNHLIIIDDLRFPLEAEMIKSRGGILIRLNCSEEERNFRIGNQLFVNKNHESETALDEYKGFDFSYNSGLIEIPALIKSVTTNIFKVK